MNTQFRGVILAGGLGTRMGLLTRITNKHLLPMGREPMILHSLRKLMRVGVTDITIVTSPEAVGDFVRMLGNGREFGCNSLTYREQTHPGGVAHALLYAEDPEDERSVVVLLGDNIFKEELDDSIYTWQRQCHLIDAFLTAFPVTRERARDYGIARFDEKDGLVEIVEKPQDPPSYLAVIGFYIYSHTVFDVIRTIKPSGRGELEITDVNNYFISKQRASLRAMSGWWHDAGTPTRYMAAMQDVFREDFNNVSTDPRRRQNDSDRHGSAALAGPR